MTTGKGSCDVDIDRSESNMVM